MTMDSDTYIGNFTFLLHSPLSFILSLSSCLSSSHTCFFFLFFIPFLFTLPMFHIHFKPPPFIPPPIYHPLPNLSSLLYPPRPFIPQYLLFSNIILLHWMGKGVMVMKVNPYLALKLKITLMVRRMGTKLVTRWRKSWKMMTTWIKLVTGTTCDESVL